MDEDRLGLVLAAGGLAAVFASAAVPRPELLILAYPLLGVATWLLVGHRIPRWGAFLGAGILGILLVLLLASEQLALGFRGHKLLDLGVEIDGLVWVSLFWLTPLATLGAGLVVRTRSWGRVSATGSLVLAGLALVLATHIVPGITVTEGARGWGARPLGVVAVLLPLILALGWFGWKLLKGPGARVSS